THESVSKLPMLFAETAFDICKQAVPHGEYACICFDSTGAMVSARTYGKQMEDGQEASAPMNTARAMSEGLPILLGLMARAASQPTIFFVCQGRDNIGAFSFRGPAEDKQTGGRALPFYSAIVARVRKGDTYKGDIDGGEKDVEVGHVTKVTIRKNKANGVQGRTALFDVYHAGGLNGIDRVSELAQLAVFTRVVIRRGAWVEYSGQPSLADGATAPSGPSVWNGLEAFKSALKAPALFALVEREVRAALTTIMDQTKDDADAD
ncbi:MAG: hypothetical protein ACREQ5_10105, partial [Candidatus Dormibacteria bacterium]